MNLRTMNLKILLPFKVFAEAAKVSKIVARTTVGSFGILPQRLDCVAALVPSIFMYEIKGQGEVFLALDGGVLIKTGSEVIISVRHAIGGVGLEQLNLLIEREFLKLSEEEKSAQAAMAKMESGFIQRLAALHQK